MDHIWKKTQGNENLTAPDPEPQAETSHNHADIRDRTLGNENLTAPTPDPVEKDFSQNGNPYAGHGGGHQHLDEREDSETALKKIRTFGSVSITPELFEKIYLSPKNRVAGQLRTIVGNPTPLAIIGFLLSLHPLPMELMNWRGAGQSGASGTGTYYFFGGLLMALGAIGEWIIGNTFPFVVFGSFSAFWLGLAATLQPFYNAYGAFSPTNNVADGLDSIGFRSGFAFFYLAMAMMCFVYMICSLRTNFCFFMIFFTLVMTFCLLAGSYWQFSNHNLVISNRLQVAAGAFAFCTAIFGWWLFIAIMLAALDFPFELPVGDLSGLIKGASERHAKEA